MQRKSRKKVTKATWREGAEDLRNDGDNEEIAGPNKRQRPAVAASIVDADHNFSNPDIAGFPLELLVHIMDYIPQLARLQVASLVCKSWCVAALDRAAAGVTHVAATSVGVFSIFPFATDVTLLSAELLVHLPSTLQSLAIPAAVLLPVLEDCETPRRLACSSITALTLTAPSTPALRLFHFVNHFRDSLVKLDLDIQAAHPSGVTTQPFASPAHRLPHLSTLSVAIRCHNHAPDIMAFVGHHRDQLTSLSLRFPVLFPVLIEYIRWDMTKLRSLTIRSRFFSQREADVITHFASALEELTLGPASNTLDAEMLCDRETLSDLAPLLVDLRNCTVHARLNDADPMSAMSFTQLRTLINASPDPNFWYRRSGSFPGSLTSLGAHGDTPPLFVFSCTGLTRLSLDLYSDELDDKIIVNFPLLTSLVVAFTSKSYVVSKASNGKFLTRLLMGSPVLRRLVVCGLQLWKVDPTGTTGVGSVVHRLLVLAQQRGVTHVEWQMNELVARKLQAIFPWMSIKSVNATELLAEC